MTEIGEALTKRKQGEMLDRMLATGALWGPAAFIAAWVAGAFVTPGFSSVDQAISQLGAVGAATRPVMNSGFAVYGAGVMVGAAGLRKTIGTPAALALGANAVSTIGVLATPLGKSTSVDQWHVVFAATGYVALVVTAGLAALRFRQEARVGLARLAMVVGSITGVSLLAVLAGTWNGLFQRVGLTTSDLWMMGLAARTVAGQLPGDSLGSALRTAREG